MARIRTIKPEFWEDEIVGKLSRDARLLFIACFNMADDEGRLRWSPAYVRSSAFMYDDDLSVTDVALLMHELTESKLVRSYAVDKGQTLAVVVNFKKHQVVNRPTASQLPPPPEEGPDALFDADFLSIPEDSLSAHGGLTLGKEGKGKEGKGKRTASAALRPIPADFALTDAMRVWAIANVPLLDIGRETQKFIDWHTAKGSTMKDWTAAWRTWMHKAVEYSGQGKSAVPQKAAWF